MNLDKHVYAIQNVLSRGAISDNKDFSNDLIAHFLKVNRSILIKRKLDKEIESSENLRITICMPMEESSFADCPDCNLPDVGCELYRSVIKLPEALTRKAGMQYVIRYINGKTIPKYTVTNNEYDSFNITGNPAKGYFIHNQYLYTTFKVKLLLVDFIPENPEDIESLNLCTGDPTSDSDPCRYSEVSFTIDPELVGPMYQMTLEFLGVSFGMPEDDLENGVSADLNKSNE